MVWASRIYEHREINDAGRTLVNSAATSAETNDALQIINNFRAAHSFPLNTFQVTLRKYARRIDRSALVAQRIKRLSSIQDKLRRYPHMELAQMQDVGGCRAVVTNIDHVRALYRAYDTSRIKHGRVRVKDYIAYPKASGYRAIHLVYRYRSDRSAKFKNTQIEIQLRSRDQHAWATAVETVGTMLSQALKSSRGEEQWLRFFALAASAIALKEGTPLVPNTPQNKDELISELRESTNALKVDARLKAYSGILQNLERKVRKNPRYFLLEVDIANRQTKISQFQFNELEKATNQYLDVEKSLSDSDGEAVLVSVESLKSLRAAYPSYFFDTRSFLKILSSLTE